MAGNSFGQLFRITTFGESHGPAIGVVIDGCPAGLPAPVEVIQKALDRRKPGQSPISSQRKETDQVEILSGVFEGKTLGTPIAMLLRNQDAKTADYEHLKETYRPSHADFTYEAKYGIRDYRGGGRASARETACRVAAGALAQHWLEMEGVKIWSYVSQVGKIILDKPYQQLDPKDIDTNIIRCPDTVKAAEMEEEIRAARIEGNTLGGIITGVVQGAAAGLGEPVYDKLQADLAKAMLSINAVKGFEYGSGFQAASMRGSEHNDRFEKKGDHITTATNHSGGIQGGISNGMDIYFRVAFKPVATLMRDQPSVDAQGKEVTVKGKGRHDPCVVPRAVPIVDAMTALVLFDHWLRGRVSRFFF